MEDNEKQSRESATQILEIKKDIEHIKYILSKMEEDSEFIKEHISLKNSQRVGDIKDIHDRIDKHIETELDYHQGVRDKSTEAHMSIHKRIAQVEKWIWVFFGGFTVVGALLGKASFTQIFGN